MDFDRLEKKGVAPSQEKQQMNKLLVSTMKMKTTRKTHEVERQEAVLPGGCDLIRIK